jgi:hypothetical protein
MGNCVPHTNAQSWRPRSTLRRALAFLLCVGLLPAIAAAQSKDRLPADSTGLPEVTVTAQRMDHRALKHAVQRFVESRSIAGTRTNQIGRWYQDVCPWVTGLQTGPNRLVARAVVDLARGVGAPVCRSGSASDAGTRRPRRADDPADRGSLIGGEGGIRTHGAREGTPVFKTGAFNRSATSPQFTLPCA